MNLDVASDIWTKIESETNEVITFERHLDSDWLNTASTDYCGFNFNT